VKAASSLLILVSLTFAVPMLADGDGENDHRPPTVSYSLSGTLSGSGWYASQVTATLSCTDNGHRPTTLRTSLDGGAYSTYTDPITVSASGTHTLAYRCTDQSGNLASGSIPFKIDLTAPQVTISPAGLLGSNGWYRSSVSITGSATDTVSGIDATRNTHSVDNAPFTSGWSTSVSTDGVHTVRLRATDLAGNTGEAGATVRIDQTPPATAASVSGNPAPGGAYYVPATVTLSATDATSGVAASEYSLDGGASWRAYGGPFSVSDGGLATMQYRSRDQAGNLEQVGSVSFQVRTCSLTPELAWQGGLASAAPYAMPAGGTLSIRFTWETCSGFIHDESVVVQVVDLAQPAYPVTAGVYGSDVSIDDATGEYRMDFTPSFYGVLPGTSLEVQVYLGGTLAGTAQVVVQP
jgi:hypothetical protein